MNYKKSKKGMELPISLVVTLIIGLIIFGLGMSLFYRISDDGEKTVDHLNAEIKSNIASLECDGDDWICAPSYTIKNKDSQVFEMYLVNKGESSGEFGISFNGASDNLKEIQKDGCGKLLIGYPDVEVNIERGRSASIPFEVYTEQVTNQGCSFITTVEMTGINAPNDAKTSLVVRVE